MREIGLDVKSSKQRVYMLKDRLISFRVNKGRNKYISFNGTIQTLYPSIFTVLATLDGQEKILSFSYSDVLTKNILFVKNLV